MGDAVNVVVWTTAAAGPFEVLVTEAALEGIAGRLQISDRRPILVKGRCEPLRLHVVHGVAENRAYYVQHRRRKRFLAGRKQVYDRLITLANLASEGESRVVGICGDAGTGKSSLLSSLADRWVELGGFGVLGRCLYSTRATPLAPIVTMLHNFFGFIDEDSEAFCRDCICFMFSFYEICEGANELVALLQFV